LHSARFGTSASISCKTTWKKRRHRNADAKFHTHCYGDRRFITALRFSANSAVNFQQPVPSASLILTGRAAVQYTGREYTNTASNEQQGSRALFDLSLGLKSPTDSWDLALFCQNCTDKRYVVQSFTTPLQTGDINAT
jgi:iron complex outermembrane receptor protein